MAKLLSPPELSGSIGQLSFYRRIGSDGVIVRRKGGPSKKQVRESPAMANTRLRNMEFSGRAKAAGKILEAIAPLKPVADYSLAGALNKLLLAVQEKDPENPLGRRAICVSRAAGLLEGFNLNRKSGWEDIITTPTAILFAAETGLVRVTVPALLPGLNFNPPGTFPLYSLVVTAGLVPDLYFTLTGYAPAVAGPFPSLRIVSTAWRETSTPSPAQVLEIETGFTGSTQQALVIAIGLRLGVPAGGGQVTAVKHVGAAKLLAIK